MATEPPRIGKLKALRSLAQTRAVSRVIHAHQEEYHEYYVEECKKLFRRNGIAYTTFRTSTGRLQVRVLR